MDPFPHDPYESDSGDEGFAWAGGGNGGAVSDARTLTEHAKALMRGDLEVSPLVTNVPPMPEYRPSAGANPVPGIPSTFRGGASQLAQKKRKIDPQAVAHAFVGESQGVILPEPSGIPGVSDRDPQRYFPTETASPSSAGQMKPPPPPGARGASQPQHPGTDMLAILTTAASQSTPLPGTIAGPKVAPEPHEQPPPDPKEETPASVGVNHGETANEGTPNETAAFEQVAVAAHPNNQETVQLDTAKTDEAMSKVSIATQASVKAAKRKTVLKVTKKVLVAKKEREIAEAILSGKDDLLEVLPREDCFFLGEEFWIFTVPQLCAVLGVGAFASVIPDDRRTKHFELLMSKLTAEIRVVRDAVRLGIEGAQLQDSDLEHGNDNIAAARARVQSWTQKLQVGLKGKPVQDRFPLDGPVSCLFPISTRRFLVSAKVKTLYEFLALKKTETGAICDFLRVWRRECKIPELPMFALAKHLIGISQRVETAIGSAEPLDATTRRWMIDPIIVLTGAAHDFLVGDQGIYTAAEFIDARTKELSLKLAEWRERNHMVPLKGSGKVAMISGWKAAAREALEAESNAGKILKDVDLAALVALENPIENEEVDVVPNVSSPVISTTKAASINPTRNPKANASKRKLTVSTQHRQVQYALSTKLFLHDVLGEEIALRLEQAGIMTAADFFEMSPETESTLRDLTVQSETTPSSTSFDELIEDWNRKLNSELERMVPQDLATSKEVPPAKKARTADKRVLVERRPVEGSSKPPGRRTAGDPFESLSAVTKRFLATMDIFTAEDFLKTRTTDIATKFVEFRVMEGMPELKGLGAIASVSGWKANVRKAARDMGKEDIVVMEPDNKSSWGPHSRNIATKPRPVATTVPIAEVVSITDSDVLDGKPRVLFAVQGGSEPEQRFRFDVALRRSDDSSPVTLVATYRGSVKCPSPMQKKTQLLECSTGDSKTSWTCPIMDYVEYIKVGKGDVDSRSMFPASGQGTGLLFLSPFGVRPVASQDLRSLKAEIQGFVVDGKAKASAAVSKSDTMCNTITRQSPLGSTEHYLFIDKSMEKGQCVEVCFRKLSSLLQTAPFRNSLFQLRHLLVESLGLLSRSDLRQILSFLEELSEKIDFQGVHSQVLGERNVENVSRFMVACCSRRRLHWIATKVAIILQEWHLVPPHQPDAMVSVNAKLYFGAILSQSVPAGLASDLRDAIREEVKQELLAALDLDKFCGSSARKSWCPLFSLTFQRFTDCILKNYVDDQSPSADAVLQNLCSCLSSCVSAPLLETLGDIAISATAGDDFASPIIDDAAVQSRHDIEPDTAEGGKEVFACEPPGDVDAEESGKSVVFCSRQSVITEGTFRLSQRWYRERQWWIVMTLIAKAGMLLSHEERLTFMHPRALFELKSQFLKETGLPVVEDPTMEMAGPVKVSSAECPAHAPPSFTFFLGLVWPKLRALGWRLEAGETPSTATFIAPDIKVIPTKRSNPWKQRRDVMRTRLARETTRTGLGNLTKVTKRVVVSVIPHPEGDAVVTEPSESKGISTAEALQRFLLHVQDDLEDDSTRELAARVVDLVKTCFDDLAPSMSTVAETEGETAPAITNQEAGAPSDRLSCDYLLRFLLVLPSILRQSELPLQEINDCTEVVSQLVSWMTMKHASLFHKKFHPSKESYAPPKQPKQTPPDLSRRLKTLHSVAAAAAAASGNSEPGSSGNALVMKEMIRPEDKYGLTDFLVMVLNQAVPCRATEHDVAKKYRRVNVGYPGFVCRHCMGQSGEGRYFFSTIESLTTASTVFEKHVGKCKHVPDEVKAAVVDAKTRHVEQRKQLPVGSQQAYFNKLWDRLRSCQIEGSASGTYVLEGTAKKSSADSLHESTEEQEFRDHRDVVEFVNARAPWKDHPTIIEALVKYYGFVEYGGRVYHTSSMPEHFSAEWLLRKVGPKPKISRKKRLMPG